MNIKGDYMMQIYGFRVRYRGPVLTIRASENIVNIRINTRAVTSRRLAKNGCSFVVECL